MGEQGRMPGETETQATHLARPAVAIGIEHDQLVHRARDVAVVATPSRVVEKIVAIS